MNRASDSNHVIDFSFDELNINNKSSNNENNVNTSNNKINNFLFTCSTPRQSNDIENNDDDLLKKYDENNTELEKPQLDVSCDLLRSSKIDLDANSDIGGGVNNEDNTDADVTTNSIYSNFNSNNQNVVVSQINKKIDYSSPINQLNSILNNIKVNYNNEGNNSNNENNYDDDSLILSKFRNDLSSIIINNTKLNTINGENGNKYFKSNSNLNTNNNTNDLNRIIEKEVLKRQHCEKQIEELNKKILQLDEQLTVVTALDRKKESFINKLERNLNKVMSSWKEQENHLQTTMNKLKQDKHMALLNEANYINRVKFLEDEMRQLNSEIINEKVKNQEHQRERNNEIQNFKKELTDLQKTDIEKSNRIEKLQNQVTLSRDEKDSLEQKIVMLNRRIEEDKIANDSKQNEMTLKINALTDSNEKINSQYESMQVEYEQLIKEAKMVVQESEKQYHHLVANIETEKRAKDALQVEISVLEEKLENTITHLNSGYETETKKLKNNFFEKEKILIDKHKTELAEIITKHQIEFDSMKAQFKNEIDFKTQDYENKIKTLNRKIDLLDGEIRNLTDTNTNLENDRNSIRMNLKQMLELQMKEAMQLLGLSDGVTFTSTKSFKEPEQRHPSPPPSFSNFNFPKMPSPLPSPLPLNLTNTNDELKHKFDESRVHNLNSISPIDSLIKQQSYYESNIKAETPKMKIESKPNNPESIELDINGSSIKDLFIKYQIDLINKCYNIDENNQQNNQQDLQIEKPKLSSSVLLAENRNFNYSANTSSKSSTASFNEQNYDQQQQHYESQNRSIKQQQQNHGASSAVASNSMLNTSNSNRTHELRYFIEMLLDKSPNGEDSKSAETNEVKKHIKFEEISKPNLASSPIINLKTPPSHAINNYQSDIDDDMSGGFYYTNSQSFAPNNNKKTSNRSYLSDDDNYGDYDKSERFYNKNNENFDDIRRNLNFELSNITPPSKVPVEVVSKLNKQQQIQTQKSLSKNDSSNSKPSAKTQILAKKTETQSVPLNQQNLKTKSGGLTYSNQSLMESSILSSLNKTQNTTTLSNSTMNNVGSTNSLATNKSKRVWK